MSSCELIHTQSLKRRWCIRHLTQPRHTPRSSDELSPDTRHQPFVQRRIDGHGTRPRRTYEPRFPCFSLEREKPHTKPRTDDRVISLGSAKSFTKDHLRSRQHLHYSSRITLADVNKIQRLHFPYDRGRYLLIRHFHGRTRCYRDQ